MIYIPICEDCFSTNFLIDNNLREFATIFDWIVLSPISVLHLFKNNFKNFFCKKNLIEINYSKKNNNLIPSAKRLIFDKYYKISFPHHINDFKKDYYIVKKKMQTRIERVEEFLKNKIAICFVYKTIKSKKKNVNLDRYKQCIKSYSKDKKLYLGLNHMKKIYPKLVKILINKYNYSENNIKIIYI
jgi:hypothetical protein